MIAGPAFDSLGSPGNAKMAHDVSVRIKNADVRDRAIRQILLAARLAQQIFRVENRLRAVMLRSQDRRHCAQRTAGHDVSGWRRKTLN